ncbi:uncharacterized protein I303_104074 [Kwoniella dejecticola CBS 10117]|uniref:WSC domain-containing protein n=1 Tax=Kwoniella dejecticola CBS 10117 TaxID=1296121 RepID=A0A1A6A8I1_9TREE|nr:uncharacterized protein I303_04093 [Kwoniella dejecticola CBS 10117]OBR86369.1 hypothetical protein I303_04093 [Kwoniella dejecticola CBS 10117]
MVSFSSLSSLVAALAFIGSASAVPVTAAASSSSAAASSSAASSSVISSAAPSASASSVSSAKASSTSSAAAVQSSAAWTIPAGWAIAPSACIAEGTSGRALSWVTTSSSSMTVEKCLQYCDNYNMPLAGLEFSGECYCGNVLGNGASLNAKSDQCIMNCNGDSGRKCGGPGALSLYVSTKDNAATLSADYTSTTVSLPSGWSSTGCYKEGKTGRALDGWSYSGIINTATCINYCKTKGYSMAGLEYGGECYCDNAFRNGAGETATTCNMPCSGGPGENCGGSNVLQVYSNPSLAPSTTISNGYNKQGCLVEVAGRALTGASFTSDSMTVDTCTYYCRSSGFNYAAVEYGKECYCGNSLANGASLSKYSNQCTMTCAGNKKQNCGGPNALVLYSM